MKFLIDWIESILQLFRVEEIGTVITEEEPVKEEPKKEKIDPVKEPKKAAAAEGPKVTKTSLTKLTKAQIQEEAAKHGVTVSTKLKKDEMVKEVLKQLK